MLNHLQGSVRRFPGRRKRRFPCDLGGTRHAEDAAEFATGGSSGPRAGPLDRARVPAAGQLHFSKKRPNQPAGKLIHSLKFGVFPMWAGCSGRGGVRSPPAVGVRWRKKDDARAKRGPLAYRFRPACKTALPRPGMPGPGMPGPNMPGPNMPGPNMPGPLWHGWLAGR